ncbi:hypothetical protein JXA84_08895 [candidate division WOR-3 bacterium]|nr:hypothetical protein [candidate division WOR-3 bacterium]
MPTAIYFLPALFFYAVFKGVIIKKNIAVRIAMNLFVFSLACVILFASFRFNTILLVLTQLYLGISLLEYILLNFGKAANDRFFDSHIYIKSEHAIVKYSVFKPILLLFADIILFTKKAPLLWINDTVDLSVASKKDVYVSIKL